MISGAVHVHPPEVQVAPGPHLGPQPPQLLGSVVVFTQPRTGPQLISPVPVQAQVALAPEPVQVSPGEQTLPHVPQF